MVEKIKSSDTSMYALACKTLRLVCCRCHCQAQATTHLAQVGLRCIHWRGYHEATDWYEIPVDGINR